MKNKQPKVVIIVVNWNGKLFLKDCLSSLKQLTYSNYEVVVVDNASTDDSQTYVRKNYPWVKLIVSDENLGYVGGNNLGIAKTESDYIFILNNDVEVKKDFLTILVNRLQTNHKIGCVQPKLIEFRQRNLLDSAGHFLTDTPFLYHYGRLKEESSPIYNRSYPIYSAKGAAMLIPRSALRKIGGAFDPDFFIYFEETDLCHRLWLAGYEVIYEPKAVIYHVVAGDTSREFSSDKTLYLSLRNRICSFIKCYEPVNLFIRLIVLFIAYLSLTLIHTVSLKFNLVGAILRAVGWNLRYLPRTLKKRRLVQQTRQATDAQIFKKVKMNPSLVYYYYLFRNRLGSYSDQPRSL